MTNEIDANLESLILLGLYQEAEEIIINGEGKLNFISEKAFEAFRCYIENS